MKKVVIGIVIVAVIVVVCYVTLANQFPAQSESPTYEVVRTYTIEVVGDANPGGGPGMVLIRYPKAHVEIKNTDSRGGLFSVYFSFSEEYFGRDLIYLKPGETGIATYTPVMKVVHFPTDKQKEYREQTAEWQYEITSVAMNS